MRHETQDGRQITNYKLQYTKDGRRIQVTKPKGQGEEIKLGKTWRKGSQIDF